MKYVLLSLTLISAVNAMGASSPGIICRDDRRLENGPLHELILTPQDGGYLLQTQYIPSLNSTDISVETLAEKLSCRIDEKATLAFCQNPEGQIAALIKERREVFYDSLEETTKKKTNKYTDISVNENGSEKKSVSFAASHCQIFNGNA